MDDFICNNCGYMGTPDGSTTCPDCGNPSMTPVKELGDDDSDDELGLGDIDDEEGGTDSLERLRDNEFDDDEESSDDEL